jgi:hypothetical protein
MLIAGIGLALSSTMFRVTEFRNRKPRTYGAVLIGIAVLLYLLAIAIVSSSTYKARQNDIRSGLLFLPFGLTFLSAGWGIIALLFILIGSKANQLGSWMRSVSHVEASGKAVGGVSTALRVAVIFISVLAYGFTVFPFTYILYRILFHLRFS